MDNSQIDNILDGYTKGTLISSGVSTITNGTSLISEGQVVFGGTLQVFTGVLTLYGIKRNMDEEQFNKEEVINKSVDNIDPSKEDIKDTIDKINKSK